MSEHRHRDQTEVAAGPNWKRRFTIGAIVAVLVILFIIFARAFFPRWWAQRVAAQVNKSFIGGVWWGLFYGIIFTALPLIVVRQALRKRFQWRWKLGIVVLAVILALPNLLTLSVVVGSGNASHAGQRIMDTEAPAFRWSTLIGAILGAIAAIAIQYLVSSRRRRGKDLDRMQRTDEDKHNIRQARERAAQAQAETAPPSE